MKTSFSSLVPRGVLAPFRAALIVLAAAGIAGCVSEPSAVTGQKRAFGYSWQQELQLGAEADKEIVQEMGLYEDPEVQAYVEGIGRRVLAMSEVRDPNAPEMYQGTEFQFRVLNSPVVNAFALPGGYVYITRGLLTHVQNEAQLAVVLGHEVAHVVARHASQQALRAQAGQLGIIAGAILGQQVLGGGGQDVASTILDLGGQAFQLLMFRYSRDAERESDNLGVKYAARAGYATEHGAAFFRTLERISGAEGRALPTWSSTHPDPGERAQSMKELTAAWTPIGAKPPVVGEEELLRRLEGMVLGEDPREGFTRDGIFYHPELKFQFPVARGWRLQNERALVLMADPNGRALLGFQIVPARSAREAATLFGQKSGAQVVSVNETRVNGLPAVTLLAQAQTQQGQLALLNVFIEYDGKVYSFLGYTAAATFAQYRPTFEAVASGFAPLRDSNLLNVQPARIAIVRVDRAAPFRTFVPVGLPHGLDAEKLAILNQVELDETIPAGRLLKLPK